MRFGVNYTPRRGWFHSWLDFDLGEVRDDLSAVADLGADHVRVFPLWPLLQPNRTLIRRQGIADVVDVAQVANDLGLEVTVDVLQGHLSSFDFLPAWVQTWHRRNLFTDPDVVAGQEALTRALARELRDIPGAAGLSIGNEFIQFAAGRHPDTDVITAADASTWLTRLLGAAREEWPRGAHVHCFDDDLWFDDTHPFIPEHAVTLGDLTTVHSWIFGSVGQRYGANAPQAAWFARWLCELAHGWAVHHGRADRGIWLQEVGAPLSHLSPDTAAQFVTDTIDILMGAHGGGVTPGLRAITWWCSHDVSRELADFPELEHTLGLLDNEGGVKPVGEAFERAARRWATTTAPCGARRARDDEPAREAIDLALAADLADRSTTSAHGQAFDAWYRAATHGQVQAVTPHLT